MSGPVQPPGPAGSGVRAAPASATAAKPVVPRWAVFAAYGAIGCVLPSALWRTAVGVGVPLGWSDAQLMAQQIPGWGTVYVLALSLLSLGAAALTLGLVRPWGEFVPARIPLVGGRRVPVAIPVALAVVGAAVIVAICVLSFVNWAQVSGFDDRTSGWALFMAACYLPALLWGPLLLAVTWAYWRRRARRRV